MGGVVHRRIGVECAPTRGLAQEIFVDDSMCSPPRDLQTQSSTPPYSAPPAHRPGAAGCHPTPAQRPLPGRYILFAPPLKPTPRYAYGVVAAGKTTGGGGLAASRDDRLGWWGLRWVDERGDG